MDLKHQLEEAISFDQDDLEFRTITTILHALDTHEKITLENFHVKPNQRSNLKLLSALSSLLVRDHEILAILPSRSVEGTKLFLSSDEQADIHDELLMPAPSRTFIARNPDPIGTVKLLDSPVVEVGKDIGEFILRNWDLSFESHVQGFANLLNTCLKSPHDMAARSALYLYSVFQSAPKVRRRLRRSPLLHSLPRLDKAVLENSATVREPSRTDRRVIEMALVRNGGAASLHPGLDKYMSSASQTPPAAPFKLSDFHQFFIWFLSIVNDQVNALNKLRKGQRAPPDFPQDTISLASKNLTHMRYFAWKSGFFASYIEQANPARIPPILEDVPMEGLAGGPSTDSGEQERAGQKDINLKEKQDLEEEIDRLDISTEFETGQDPISLTENPLPVHPCVLELRLITSNIQHLITLLRKSPLKSFELKVIQYPRSDRRAKPWREVVDELFPENIVRDQVLHALMDETGCKFNIFRSLTPVPQFNGQEHCEAVLGCLYSLATRGDDISWTRIPPTLLDAIKNCYSILAPSKRCCPVCAKIISLLSAEGLSHGGRYIHALSKHSVIFPCALPVGLPRSIRETLLSFYRQQLRQQLQAFLLLQPSKSGRSEQSEPFSQDGEESEDEDDEDAEDLRQFYGMEWEQLDAEQRRIRWKRARATLRLKEQIKWWGEMPDELKVGLTPPEN